jgi:drug/metabolite transporter (DMT)-like permease
VSARRRSVILLTLLAMVAFAANSLLCRLALREGGIAALAFTALRLGSGALVLFLIECARRRRWHVPTGGSWTSAVMLAIYAAGFSLAYLGLTAGTGALILFGCVQVTMIVWGIVRGERPDRWQWVGLALAVIGLVYLVAPGLTAPPAGSALLMALAGVAWGVYSLRGGRGDPIATTAGNFVRTVPLVVVGGLIASGGVVSTEGVLLAVVSGAVTSGVGYVLWYGALHDLTATRAAVVQLSVPVIAALGGAVLLAEAVTWRLGLASAITLGGIALVIAQRRSAAVRQQIRRDHL